MRRREQNGRSTTTETKGGGAGKEQLREELAEFRAELVEVQGDAERQS